MQPFELGWQAGWRGDDPRTCPYEKMTQEWNEWQQALSIAAKSRKVADHARELANSFGKALED